MHLRVKEGKNRDNLCMRTEILEMTDSTWGFPVQVTLDIDAKQFN